MHVPTTYASSFWAGFYKKADPGPSAISGWMDEQEASQRDLARDQKTNTDQIDPREASCNAAPDIYDHYGP